MRESVAEGQSTVVVGEETMQVGAYLERFLFDRNAQRKRVSVLSGGERARLCLARLMCQKTNLLLLDEPTNDLDVATLGALEEMLIDYGGSALVVSHDRWFLDRVATSILAFEADGIVELHRGGYSDYRERRRARERSGGGPAARREPKGEAASGKPGSDASSTRAGVGSGSKPKKLTYTETRELDGLFELIEAAEQEVDRLEASLADPATYQGGGDGVSELTTALETARDQVAGLTTRWEELEARKAASAS